MSGNQAGDFLLVRGKRGHYHVAVAQIAGVHVYPVTRAGTTGEDLGAELYLVGGFTITVEGDEARTIDRLLLARASTAAAE